MTRRATFQRTVAVIRHVGETSHPILQLVLGGKRVSRGVSHGDYGIRPASQITDGDGNVP